MSDVLATDCNFRDRFVPHLIREGSNLGLYKWVFGLSWLPVPRIDHWASDCTCPPVENLNLKMCFAAFPQEVCNGQCVASWLWDTGLWTTFDTRSCACSGILPEFWFVLMVVGLTGYQVPRIEHWEGNYTCPPAQIWSWKCVFAPLLEWLINCSLIVFCRHICSIFIWYKKWLWWYLASVFMSCWWVYGCSVTILG